MASADRLIEVFNEAKARPPGAERDQYLATACRGEPALQEQVLSLLQADDGAGDFLQQEQPSLQAGLLTEKPGDRIGRYRLLQQIGEGGCGVVYMAEQEEPVRRRVALKVIKLGMDTRSVIARFEAERQALAMMDHPSIARVFDAGATDTGRPFFVMELVHGIKITDYCAQNNLPTAERLELFIQTCQAIQHAHQKGIIHRDIKPSNILVTQTESAAVPKVIDFGIAKATKDQRLTDNTVFTAFEQFIGTPAYMSPEQAMMMSMDIDTRTDIYALGVLLYELLTGQTPFDAKELMAAGLDSMRRIIREVEPVKPSTRLTQDLVAADVRRRTLGESDPPSPSPRRLQELIHLLRGDLDWIVMKALEKDRKRRYETATGLAADVQRHLNHEPVTACPPSRWYEFQKSVQRHKFGFAAAAALILVLALGVFASTWQALRATRAEREQNRFRQRAEANEQRATTEAAKSRQIATFLEEMLKGIGPSVALGRDTTMLREILDKTVERLAEDMRGQPEVQAELRTTIGHIYHQLGDFQKAHAMHGEALRLRKALYGETNAWVAASLSDVAYAVDELGRPDEAETLQRTALAMRRELLGNDHLDVAISLERLADTLSRQREMAESEVARRESLEIRRKLSGSNSLEVADTLNDLSTALVSQGKPEEAEAVAREALAICRKLFGDEHPSLATSLFRLSRVLQLRGRLDAAETAAREALAMRRKLLGNEHPYVRSALDRLANVLQGQGKFAEAEEALREGLALRRATLGYDEAQVTSVAVRLAGALRGQGKLVEAETTLREVLTTRKKLFGDTHPEVAAALHALAEMLRDSGQWSEAESAFREAVAMRRKLLGSEHPDLAATLGQFSFLLRERNKLAEAEITARENLAICRTRFGDEHVEVAHALHLLAWNINLRSKHAEAEALSREALAIRRKIFGSVSIEVAATLCDLAYFLRDQKKMDELEAVACEALAISEHLAAQTTSFDYHFQRLGHSQWHLAGGLDGENQRELAQRALQNSLVAFEKAERISPSNPFFRQEQAFSHRLLGELAVRVGRIDDAEGHYRLAKSLYAGLKANAPKSVFYRGEECHTVWRLATILDSAAREDSALAEFYHSLALHEQAVADFPEDADLKTRLHGARNDLVSVLVRRGRTTEAEVFLREALAKQGALVGNDHRSVGQLLVNLANELQRQGKHAEAEMVGRELVALRRKLPADDPQLVAALAGLTQTLLFQRKFAEAELAARECLAIRERIHPDDWLTFNSRSLLGESLLGQRKFTEAEPLLVAGYEGMKQLEDKISGANNERIKESIQRLVQLYEGTGQADEVAKWNKMLAEFEKADSGR